VTAGQQRPRRRHALRVEIIPLTMADRDTLVPVFWSLVGALASDVLLDGSHGPWEDAVLTRHDEAA
jgi:hypothetical protein